jgi:hypothetical protein
MTDIIRVDTERLRSDADRVRECIDEIRRLTDAVEMKIAELKKSDCCGDEGNLTDIISSGLSELRMLADGMEDLCRMELGAADRFERSCRRVAAVIAGIL